MGKGKKIKVAQNSLKHVLFFSEFLKSNEIFKILEVPTSNQTTVQAYLHTDTIVTT